MFHANQNLTNPSLEISTSLSHKYFYFPNIPMVFSSCRCKANPDLGDSWALETWSIRRFMRGCSAKKTFRPLNCTLCARRSNNDAKNGANLVTVTSVVNKAPKESDLCRRKLWPMDSTTPTDDVALLQQLMARTRQNLRHRHQRIVPCLWASNAIELKKNGLTAKFGVQLNVWWNWIWMLKNLFRLIKFASLWCIFGFLWFQI